MTCRWSMTTELQSLDETGYSYCIYTYESSCGAEFAILVKLKHSEYYSFCPNCSEKIEERFKIKYKDIAMEEK